MYNLLEVLADSPLALIQGTKEWLSLRKTKITATDACAIMGVSPWKTAVELYHEKMSDDDTNIQNDRMKRGTDLEPIARDLFSLENGVFLEPRVIIKDWAMASLDGISGDGETLVEIKCPGKKDHDLAIYGKIPDHYYPQLQHQMYVCEVGHMFYYSFDGVEGVTIKVQRDNNYIKKMIEQEKIFYDCMMNKTPPKLLESDYCDRNDDFWVEISEKWIEITSKIKELEKYENDLRNQLISMTDGKNSKGGGISLCQVQRKGNVDYSKVTELKGVDLEKYRKESTNSWRITCD